MGADLFDGEAGDAHPGGGQAEKRVFVHAGKPPTAVADVDAPVVEIAQGLGGEDMRGEEKAVGVGNRGENAVERIADVLPVAGIGDLSVEAGVGLQSTLRQPLCRSSIVGRWGKVVMMAILRNPRAAR